MISLALHHLGSPSDSFDLIAVSPCQTTRTNCNANRSAIAAQKAWFEAGQQ